jgi:transcriptional regulator with XRE-family HTH domain
MIEVGNKIKELRKKKGLSQEELAENSKVNLRTIQRIENNENEPRGKTLNLICHVLEVNAEDILDHGKEEDNDYLLFFHLSVLAFLVIPLGNIILPLILWMTKKDKITGLKETGANVLNFQILWSFFTSLSVMIFAYFKIVHIGSFKIFIYLFFALYVINMILPVYFAINAKKGILKKYSNPVKLIR